MSSSDEPILVSKLAFEPKLAPEEEGPKQEGCGQITCVGCAIDHIDKYLPVLKLENVTDECKAKIIMVTMMERITKRGLKEIEKKIGELPEEAKAAAPIKDFTEIIEEVKAQLAAVMFKCQMLPLGMTFVFSGDLEDSSEDEEKED